MQGILSGVVDGVLRHVRPVVINRRGAQGAGVPWVVERHDPALEVREALLQVHGARRQVVQGGHVEAVLTLLAVRPVLGELHEVTRGRIVGHEGDIGVAYRPLSDPERGRGVSHDDEGLHLDDYPDGVQRFLSNP